MAAKSTEAVQETDEKEGADGAAPKRSRLRTIVLAVGALAVVGGAGGGYYYFSAHKSKDEKVAASNPAKPPAFLDIPEVLVNLSGTGDRTQYLKVKLVLELADASMVPQIQPVLPRVIDAFQVFLRELRPADLEGSAGTYRLKEELTRRVNAAIAPSRINAVLFKEMVIQ